MGEYTAQQLLEAYARGERNFAHITLAGADLHGADLRDANFLGANLSGCDLSGADLSRANLGVANLHGANLRGANLSGAILEGAQTDQSDLTITVADKPPLVAPSKAPLAPPIPAAPPTPWSPPLQATPPPPPAGAASSPSAAPAGGAGGGGSAQFCVHCGASLPAGAMFCPRCGQSQSAMAPAGAPPVYGAGAPSQGAFVYSSAPPPIPVYPSPPPAYAAPAYAPPSMPVYAAPAPPPSTPAYAPPPPSMPAYAPPPPAQRPFSSTLTPQRNRSVGAVIATVGAGIAVLAFFILPYVTIPLLGSITGAQAANAIHQLYALCTSLSQYTNAGTSCGFDSSIFVWLQMGLAAVAVIAAGWAWGRIELMGEDNSKGAMVLVIIASILDLLLLILPLIGLQSSQAGEIAASLLGIGYWLMPIGMVVSLIGAIRQLAR